MSATPGKSFLDEFRDNLESRWEFRVKRNGQENDLRNFYHTPKIQRWLLKIEDGQPKANVARLWAEIAQRSIYYDQTWENKLERVMEGPEQSLMVLSCLIKARLEKYTFAFHRAGIYDSCMHKSSDKHGTLRNILEDEVGVDQILDRFENSKWAFCPVLFDSSWASDFHKAFDGETIFPYCYRSRVIEKGGMASVETVLIPKGFESKEMRESFRTLVEHEKFGECYRVALKSYTKYSGASFERDVTGLFSRRGEEGTVRFFGCYKIHSSGHTILLEHADSDLEEFYWGKEPPSSEVLIVKAWTMLFKLAEVLIKIHNPSPHVVGCHGDIKPDNLLLFGEILRFTDFGTARFQAAASQPQSRVGNRMKATHICCSPEAGESHAMAADLWSFGTILSTHATWIIAGTCGLLTFEHLRTQANEKIGRTRGTGTFHDGKRVLKEVGYWHDHLKKRIRPTDPISLRVLELVDNNLLVSNPEKRLTAEQLKRGLDNILEHAQKQHGRQTHLSPRADAAINQAFKIAKEEHLEVKRTHSNRMRRMEEIQPKQKGEWSEPSNGLLEPSLTSSTTPTKAQVAEAYSSGSSKRKSRLSFMSSQLVVPQRSGPETITYHRNDEPMAGPASATTSRMSTESRHPSNGRRSLTSNQPNDEASAQASMEMPRASGGNTRHQREQSVWEAIQHGGKSHIQRARLALDSDSSLAISVNNNGQTPLMIAAESQNLEMIKLLLLRPYDISATDKRGRTVLHHLIAGLKHNAIGKSDLCEIIHQLEKIVGVRDNEGDSPLHLACSGTNSIRTTIVDALIDKGAEVDLSDLYTAMDLGNRYIVESLLEKGKLSESDMKEAELSAKKEGNKEMRTLVKEYRKRG